METMKRAQEPSMQDDANTTVIFLSLNKTTVKFLNFGMPEIIAVIYLKFKQRDQTFGYFVKMMQME